MTYQKRFASFFTSLFFLFIAGAAQATISDAKVFQLMDKSGMTRAIENLPAQMQAMSQQMAMVADDQASHKEFESLFLSTLNSDEMLADIKAYIQANVNDAQVDTMLAWLNTDLAGRIVAAELQSSDPQFQQNFMRYFADLQANPPSEERTAAVVSFVKESQMVEQSKHLVMTLLDNMFGAAKAAEPDNTELAAELDAQLQNMSAGLDAGMQQQMILSSYYIYRDISNDELAEYGAFYQQDEGKAYLNMMFSAIGEAVNKWGVKLIDKVAEQAAQ